MTRNGFVIAASVMGLIAAFSAAAHGFALDKTDYCKANPYGIDGQLSQQDLNDMFYLAFPQNVTDMRGRFGSPLCFDGIADYYQIEGTTHFIAVDYDGSQAIGWRAWEVVD